jgi:hypothetical protein
MNLRLSQGHDKYGGAGVPARHAHPASSIFVILSAAKDLVFSISYEILRSLRSLRMTV